MVDVHCGFQHPTIDEELTVSLYKKGRREGRMGADILFKLRTVILARRGIAIGAIYEGDR